MENTSPLPANLLRNLVYLGSNTDREGFMICATLFSHYNKKRWG